jgi:uncharacterized protein
MKIQGQHAFNVPRARVWAAVMDPTVIAGVLPGCEDLKSTGENTFEGLLKIKVGPVQGQFKGSVVLSQLVPPESYQLDLKGQGPPGFVDGSGSLRLEESGPAATLLHYDIDAKVGGRIASVGQRLLDSSAKVITRRALEGLEQQLAQREALEAAATAAADATAAAGDTAPPPAPAPPSQAEFAASFTRGLVGELVPPERRPLYIALALGLLVVAFFGLKACFG